jgi:hypothetical protein
MVRPRHVDAKRAGRTAYRPTAALIQPRLAHRQQLFFRKPPCWSTSPVPLQSGHSTLAGMQAVAVNRVFKVELAHVRVDHDEALIDQQ